MMRSLWVEAVITPQLTWADGRLLEPCTPFELNRRIKFGPRESDPDIHWLASHQLVLTPGPGGVFYEDSRARGSKTRPQVRPGVCWIDDLLFRVLSAPEESAGWPRTTARPAGPWNDATLQVIADQLLELELSVGQRFIARDEKTDLDWLPIRHAQVTWRKGVVDTLRCAALGGWEFGRALGVLAVCMPLRELTISCREPIQPIPILEALITSGGLPCLDKLVFDVSQLWPVSALREVVGFAEAFPLLNTLEIKNSRPPSAIG